MQIIEFTSLVRCCRCRRVRRPAPTNRSFCVRCWTAMAPKVNRALEEVKQAIVDRAAGR